MITSFLMLAHVLTAVLLIILVLIQRSEGGLGSLGGGGGDSLMGAAGTGNVLTRATKWMFIFFMALSLVLAMQMAGKGDIKSVVEKQEATTTEAPAVNVPSEIPADSTTGETNE